MKQGEGIDRRSMMAGMAVAGMSAATGDAAQARSSRRPNILFILADDLRFDGVGYRNPMVHTPNIDKLAGRGTRFSNAFITTSICCTSRASIQTGAYARHHQVWDFTTALTEEVGRFTYPRLLRQNGYRTGYFGKYGIGDFLPRTNAQLAQDFDESRTFEDYYPKDDVAREHHNNRRISELAQAFIRSSTAGKPFCLTLGFKAPHAKDDGDPVMGPYVAEPDMFALYEHDIFRRNAIMNDEAFATLPIYIQQSEARRRWQQRFSNDQLWQDSVRKYFGLVSGMDRAIGQILAALEAVGLVDDTLIIFASDNGYLLGDYGLEGKWFGYEASIRVPLIIVPPGGSKPREVSTLALNVDLAPTMLAAAGIETPSQMKGRSLLPMAQGTAQPKGWRQDFLYEHFFPGLYNYKQKDEAILPSSEGVRNDRYTYLRYPRQAGPNEMLFDRQADPDELRNNVKSCDPALLRSLRQRTDQLIAEMA